MKIEQITDADIISQIKERLHLDDMDVVAYIRREDNGNEYMLIQRGDGSGFLFQNSNNDIFEKQKNRRQTDIFTADDELKTEKVDL